MLCVVLCDASDEMELHILNYVYKCLCVYFDISWDVIILFRFCLVRLSK